MIVAAVAMVVAAAVSAYGAVQSGQAQKSALDRQAAIDQQNATIASQDRQTNIAAAQLAEQDKARSDSQRLAAIRASYGTSGLELAGSPLDVLTDTSNSMALDERRVAYQGEVTGRQDAIKILGLQNDAAAATAAGSYAQSASYLTAGSDLLKGVSSAGGAAFGGDGGGDGGDGGASLGSAAGILYNARSS